MEARRAEKTEREAEEKETATKEEKHNRKKQRMEDEPIKRKCRRERRAN